MMKHARGLICMAMEGKRLDALEIDASCALIRMCQFMIDG
jgi:3,4-dihydroxy-2-butanone 4-phosphate synthase